MIAYQSTLFQIRLFHVKDRKVWGMMSADGKDEKTEAGPEQLGGSRYWEELLLMVNRSDSDSSDSDNEGDDEGCTYVWKKREDLQENEDYRFDPETGQLVKIPCYRAVLVKDSDDEDENPGANVEEDESEDGGFDGTFYGSSYDPLDDWLYEPGGMYGPPLDPGAEPNYGFQPDAHEDEALNGDEEP